MDEFSDFQMAVGPSSHNSDKGNTSRNNFPWGGSQKGSAATFGDLVPTSQTNQYSHHGSLGSHSQQKNNILIGPPPPSQPNNQHKADKMNVGSRLANYDLGRKSNIPQHASHKYVPHNNSTTTNNSLIGEEDKYAALRALVSLDDGCDTEQANFSSTPVVHHNGHNNMSPKSPPSSNAVKDDDFSDFGDFQSFSNSENNQPKLYIGAVAAGGGPISANNIQTREITRAPSCSFDFGDFISVVPETTNVSQDYSDMAEIRDFNFDTVSGDTFEVDSSGDLNMLTTDWEDMSTLNNSSEISAPPQVDTTIHLRSDMSFFNHRESSNNNNNNELNLKHVPNIVKDLPARVSSSITVETFCNTIESASLNAITHNIPLDDLHVLPVSFIKTSSIGCDVGRISDIDNLESARSASLMETSNEILESHERNKSDISPETRSIASLDLGSYCLTFDPTESKISSPDNNWNSGSITPTNRFSKQSHGENDDSFCLEQESNDSMSDKYQCFREDLETEANVHLQTWSRCLESIKLITNSAVALFSGAEDSNIVRQVVLSQTGENYINCLCEVYIVFNRVQSSYNQVGKMKLDTLCSEIESLWDTLMSYFIGTDVLDKFTNSATTEITGFGKRCGICSCSIQVQSSSIEYDGILYHSNCANLWINNVEIRLPSLSSASGCSMML